MSTLMEELTAIKAVEDKLTANKVANFAYTDHAYNNPLTEADGVETYDVDSEQNIPVANASILKVNTTILTKGWRAQASAITRMLMNHFLGRCSYNLNKVNDLFSLLLTKLMTFMGVANGIATLDANGRIPYSQLPESAIELKGYWDADTNTPSLADGTGTNGDEYIVSVAGTQDLGSGSQYFNVGDRVLYTGGVWKNITSGFVRTVNSNPPDAQGNIRSVLGSSSFPITRKFFYAMFGKYLGDTWFQGEQIGLIYAQKPVYANGIWVVMGNIVQAQASSGATLGIWWSEDGKNWSKTDDNLGGAFGLTYAGGLWLCSRYGSGLYWSVDGKNWTQGTLDGSPTSTCDRIIYVNGLWFASTLNASGSAENAVSVLWSEDGKEWHWGTRDADLGTLSMTGMNNIEYANGIFLVKRTTTGGSSSLCLAWSEDGKVWHACLNTADSQPLLGIAGHGDIIYANNLWSFAKNGYVWWSEDGKNWTQGTGISEAGGDYALFVYANGLRVYGYTKGLYWSEDGKAWTQVTGSINSANIYTLKYLNGLWLCGTSAGEVSWSTDGKNWYAGDKDSSATTDGVSDFDYKNGVWICSAFDGIYQSLNGKSWTKVCAIEGYSTNPIIGALVYREGLWICGGRGLRYTSLEDLIESGAIDLGADIPIVNE